MQIKSPKGLDRTTKSNPRFSHLCFHETSPKWRIEFTNLMFKFNPHLLSHASCNFNARLNHQKFVPFGWRVTLLDLKKKRRGAEIFILKKMRVGQVLSWSCFRLFPTVSHCFRLFHFVWTINWTNSIYGRLIQCKPVQTMTLNFQGARTLHQLLHLDFDIQYSLKISKSQEFIKFD